MIRDPKFSDQFRIIFRILFFFKSVCLIYYFAHIVIPKILTIQANDERGWNESFNVKKLYTITGFWMWRVWFIDLNLIWKLRIILEMIQITDHGSSVVEKIWVDGSRIIRLKTKMIRITDHGSQKTWFGSWSEDFDLIRAHSWSE